MDIYSISPQATPMPAPTRARWVALDVPSLRLSLAPADVAELDPEGLGSITLFGVQYAPAR